MSPVSSLSDVSYFRSLRSQSLAGTEPLHTRWEKLYRAVFETGTSLSTRSAVIRAQRPRDNEIFPIIDSLTGWLQDQHPVLGVVPGSYDPTSPFFASAESLARDLESLLLTSLRSNKFHSQQQRVFWDTLTYGTGCYKVTWDEDADDGAGKALAARTDPWFLHPDPLATSMDDLTWIVEDRVIYREEAHRRYGEAADRAVNTNDRRPSQFSSSGGPRPPMAQAGGIVPPGSFVPQPTMWSDTAEDSPDSTGTDMVTVHEIWFKEDNRWMFAVWSGQQILSAPVPVYDIYEHGRPPYIRYVASDTGEFWGPSLVEYLLDLQQSLDDTLFHIAHFVHLAGNPIMLEPRSGGTQRTSMKYRPGQRIPVQGSSNMFPQWLGPPELPAWIVQLLGFWESAMERTSGLQQVNRGSSPRQRQSQGTTDRVSESGLVRVRAMLANHEDTTRELGELLASVITENYTDATTLAILGPGGAGSALALKSKHFYTSAVEGPIPEVQDIPLRFAVHVEPGSALPTSKQAKEDMAIRLRNMGSIDDQALLDVLEFPNRAQILQRVMQMKIMGLLTQPPARQRSKST